MQDPKAGTVRAVLQAAGCEMGAFLPTPGLDLDGPAMALDGVQRGAFVGTTPSPSCLWYVVQTDDGVIAESKWAPNVA